MKIVQLDAKRRVVYIPSKSKAVYQVLRKNQTGDEYWDDCGYAYKMSDDTGAPTSWLFESLRVLLEDN